MTDITTAGLPKGYDDTSSPYYVPEHLRGEYAVTEPERPREQLAAYRIASVDAEDEWRRRHVRVQDPRRVILSDAQSDAQNDRIARTHVADQARVKLNERRDYYESVADHQSRIRRAAIAIESRQANAEINAANAAVHTCPSCGEYRGPEGGPAGISEHVLADGSRISTCTPCGVIANQYVIDRITADTGRREAVGTFLHSLNLI